MDKVGKEGGEYGFGRRPDFKTTEMLNGRHEECLNVRARVERQWLA